MYSLTAQPTMEAYGALFGRIMLSSIFLLSAFWKISNPPGTAQILDSVNMPLVPVALVVAVLVELFGALAILTGFKCRIGAMFLFVYLIPVTLIFHNFWDAPIQLEHTQTIQFMKNLAIMGGLLMLALFGPGPLSVDTSEYEIADHAGESSDRSPVETG